MAIPRHLLEAWSRGEVSRRELADRLGQELRFGDLLAALHEAGLPLPRVPSDPASPGRRLLREALGRRHG